MTIFPLSPIFPFDSLFCSWAPARVFIHFSLLSFFPSSIVCLILPFNFPPLLVSFLHFILITFTQVSILSSTFSLVFLPCHSFYFSIPYFILLLFWLLLFVSSPGVTSTVGLWARTPGDVSFYVEAWKWVSSKRGRLSWMAYCVDDVCGDALRDWFRIWVAA